MQGQMRGLLQTGDDPVAMRLQQKRAMPTDLARFKRTRAILKVSPLHNRRRRNAEPDPNRTAALTAPKSSHRPLAKINRVELSHDAQLPVPVRQTESEFEESGNPSDSVKDRTALEEAEGTEDGESSVATDLVIARPDCERRIVIPLKITTRERIVQPFAHQRILDSAFGKGLYNSFLTCVSETQLDHKTQSVKQVCVPGTVKLFQRHLGQISGLYYCDVPQRYAADDMAAYLPVKEIGEIFRDFGRYFNN